ncbi:MAG: peptidoglycan-binding domain-containing protein [Ktedonobacterales bacterium]
MRAHHVAIMGSILLVASFFLAFTPVASNALAAARTAHSDSRASTSTQMASSHLPANASCPPSCPNQINSCPPTLQQGSSGTWVQILDYRLNNINAGGTPLSISTSFTAATKTAVVDFQKFASISHDGIVGPQTWSFLSFCTAYDDGTIMFGGRVDNPHCPAGLSENTNILPWVSALQDLLNGQFNVGFFTTSPDSFTPYLDSDGIFGPMTKAAVADFQAALGLGTNGGVGNGVWNGLSMCY